MLKKLAHLFDLLAGDWSELEAEMCPLLSFKHGTYLVCFLTNSRQPLFSFKPVVQTRTSLFVGKGLTESMSLQATYVVSLK